MYPPRRPVKHQLICASTYHPGACGCIPPVTLIDKRGMRERTWTIRDAILRAQQRSSHSLAWSETEVLRCDTPWLIDAPSLEHNGNQLVGAGW